MIFENVTDFVLCPHATVFLFSRTCIAIARSIQQDLGLIFSRTARTVEVSKLLLLNASYIAVVFILAVHVVITFYCFYCSSCWSFLMYICNCCFRPFPSFDLSVVVLGAAFLVPSNGRNTVLSEHEIRL